MQEFKGKVAVVTGAASGIGLGLARHCAKEGMKVVLADIAEDRLHDAERTMRAEGHEVFAVRCDVSNADGMRRLAKQTVDRFNVVHLLFNNAGLDTLSDVVNPLWKASDHDWELITKVNLQGVINGFRTFLPIMLSQGTEGHVVNTASAAGLLTYDVMGIYAMTKHAIVCLSETLYLQLARVQSRIGVSVLCPGVIQTDAMEAALRHHRGLPEAEQLQALTEGQQNTVNYLSHLVRTGMPPSEAAEMTFDAIRNGRFYIITHRYILENLKTRCEIILEGGNPMDLALERAQ